ncbi:MAG: hypothetical protein MAG431_01286 [Chloroflexi bacterium]|nr:hypothetical protein [Chloroflexota bacterium]
MAGVTTHKLIENIIAVCAQSPIVRAYTVRSYDLDILSMRIHLLDDSFIEVFYNIITNKTAFTYIVEDIRVYGKDNTKMGWHVHPMGNPTEHISCEEVSFSDFLAEVEEFQIWPDV